MPRAYFFLAVDLVAVLAAGLAGAAFFAADLVAVLAAGLAAPLAGAAFLALKTQAPILPVGICHSCGPQRGGHDTRDVDVGVGFLSSSGNYRRG